MTQVQGVATDAVPMVSQPGTESQSKYHPYNTYAEKRLAVMDCYTVHKQQISFENTLINQRTTWIVSSQAFLLGTYTFLVNAPILWLTGKPDALGQVLYPGTMPTATAVGSYFMGAQFQMTVDSLRGIFQAIGIVASGFVFWSILSAIQAIKDTLENYGNRILRVANEDSKPEDTTRIIVKRIHERYGLPDIKSKAPFRRGGLMAPIALPTTFFFAWVAVAFRIDPFHPFQQFDRAGIFDILVIVVTVGIWILVNDNVKDD